jgi:hypothetical protein
MSGIPVSPPTPPTAASLRGVLAAPVVKRGARRPEKGWLT